MAQAEHERSLVSRLEGRPFAIVGVNADRLPPEQVLRHNERSAIPGVSFTNDSKGLAGPITTRWHVRTLPTTYLIDHRGVIVAKWVGTIAPPDELTEAVLAAVERAEAAKSKSKSKSPEGGRGASAEESAESPRR